MPSSFSSFLMCVDTLDWTVASASAAAEKDPCSAMAMMALSCRRSIDPNDSKYLLYVFDVYAHLVHTGIRTSELCGSPLHDLKVIKKGPDPPSGPFFMSGLGVSVGSQPVGSRRGAQLMVETSTGRSAATDSWI